MAHDNGMRAERTLAITEQITHIGSWEWRPPEATVRWSDELYRIYGYEPQSRAITPEFFLSHVHPDDRERVQRHVARAIEQGGEFQWSERIVRPDGTVRILETVGEVQAEAGSCSLFGTCRDVTEQNQQLEQINRYADICKNVQIGLMVWSADGRERVEEFTLATANPLSLEYMQLDSGACLGKRYDELLTVQKPSRVDSLLEQVAADGRVREIDAVEWGAAEPPRLFAFKAFPLPGKSVGLAVLEVTREAKERHLRERENAVLEQVAGGVPLEASLESLIRAVEVHAAPAIGSVLILDPDGKRVRHGAAPGLPVEYREAIDGLPIGPRAGSCGTAAFTKQPVFVDDIETDPLWDDYRELALRHGLRACWSVPIIAKDQRVLGTFAFYYTNAHRATPAEVEVIERVSRLAGIAIERSQMEGQLRDLSAHVQSALEGERTRIAREIHDDLGQSLTALKMDIAWVVRRLRELPQSQGAPLLDKLAQMSGFTDEVIQRVRQISAELRPGVLDDLGLTAAIEWQAQAFEERTGMPCQVRSNQHEVELDSEVTTAAFRIVQEALTNIVRHARANSVRVDITVDASELSIEVSDDGVGITREATSSVKSLGLLGVRERAHRLGGEVVVEQASPKGTVVRLRLPRHGARAA